MFCCLTLPYYLDNLRPNCVIVILKKFAKSIENANESYYVVGEFV